MTKADEMVDQAVKKFTVQDFSGAESLLLDALALEADHLLALNNLGHIQLLKKDLEEAARLLDRAMSIDPDFVPATLGRAKVYLASRAFDEALRTVQSVRENLTDENRADFFHIIGLVFVGKRDWDTALNFLERYALEQPGSLHARTAVYQTCLNAGYESRALDELERITIEFPGESTPWIQLLNQVRNRKEADRLPPICRRLAGNAEIALGVLNYAAQCCLDSERQAYAAWMARAALDRHEDFDRTQFTALASAERFL
jgi:tetratricopeptide (TPR) repeat protein